MSIRAISWVLYQAEVDDHGDFRLLVALADRASDDGTGAFPSVDFLAKRMRRTPRSVQRGLRKLMEDGWIRLGDQQLVAHYRADRRPTVYDLVMDRTRGDADVTPPLNGATPSVTPPNSNEATSYVTPLHPHEVTPDVTPHPARGDIHGTHGVTSDVTQTVPSLLRNETVQESGAPSALGTPDDDEPKRKRPAIRLPADWAPTEAHRESALNAGVDVAVEAHKFRLHAAEQDRRCVSWNAAFSRWLMNARPTRPVTSGVSETGRLWQD